MTNFCYSTTEAQLMNASIGNESTPNATTLANTSANSSSSSDTETVSKGMCLSETLKNR